MSATVTLTRQARVAILLTVALAAAVAQGFGRFTYGVVLPDVRDDLLDGSNTAAGLLGTANTAAYLAGTLIVASVATRLGPVAMMRVGLAFSVSGIGLAVIAPNGVALAGALVLMGLGGAAIWIPSPGLASSVVSVRRRGLAVGIMGSGVGAGIVFSGQLASVLEDQGRSWRSVYGVHTVIGLVSIVAALVILRRVRSGTSAAGGFGGFATLRRMDGWKPLTGCYAVYGFGYLLVIAFLVARLEDDSGYSATAANGVFTVMGASTIVGGITLGRLSDRFGRRRALSGGYAAFAAATLVILTGWLPAVLLGAATVGILFGGLATVIAAYIVDRTDALTYGPSYAAATLAFGLAQVLSPQAGGALADASGSFGPVFMLSAGIMSTGAVIALALPRDHLGAR